MNIDISINVVYNKIRICERRERLMKAKIIAAVCVLIPVLLIIYGSIQTPSEADAPDDALRIYPYVFSADITDPHSEQASDADGSFDILRLNEPRYLVPFPEKFENLNIRFEFDGGIIELISDDRDVQLSVGDSPGPWHGGGYYTRTFAASLRVPDGGYIAINPMGSGRGFRNYYADGGDWTTDAGWLGREYYLTVNTYKFDNESSPVIKATLKLTQLSDPGFPDNDGSAYYSIELVSYEYSDFYKIMSYN